MIIYKVVHNTNPSCHCCRCGCMRTPHHAMPCQPSARHHVTHHVSRLLVIMLPIMSAVCCSWRWVTSRTAPQQAAPVSTAAPFALQPAAPQPPTTCILPCPAAASCRCKRASSAATTSLFSVRTHERQQQLASDVSFITCLLQTPCHLKKCRIAWCDPSVAT